MVSSLSVSSAATKPPAAAKGRVRKSKAARDQLRKAACSSKKMPAATASEYRRLRVFALCLAFRSLNTSA